MCYWFTFMASSCVWICALKWCKCARKKRDRVSSLPQLTLITLWIFHFISFWKLETGFCITVRIWNQLAQHHEIMVVGTLGCSVKSSTLMPKKVVAYAQKTGSQEHYLCPSNHRCSCKGWTDHSEGKRCRHKILYFSGTKKKKNTNACRP